MNYKDFMHALINDETAGIYLFDSKEDFLNDTIIEEVRRKLTIPDFNLLEIKGNADVETIKTAYETYPVMEDKKYIIIRNVDLAKNSLKDYETMLAAIMDDIEDFPAYASLFIFSENSPFKGKFYKAVDKHGIVVKIDRLNRAELESFVGKRFVRNGKKIQKSLVASIVDRFSYLGKDSEIDLYEVVNAVDKIIANSTEEVVTAADVGAQLDEVLNLNIFNLTDAISNKNPKLATATFLSLAGADEDLFMIYHMLIRQARNLFGVKSLYTSGFNDNFIMKNLGIGSFELKKLKGFSTNFSIEELLDIHSRLFDMEVRQKSLDFDMRIELLLLIRQFASN